MEQCLLIAICLNLLEIEESQDILSVLDIANGIVPRKKGSAVARDLKKVLDESPDFKRLANENKYITIRLNSDFELIVQVI